MPGGFITVDCKNTFGAAIFLGAAGKTIFGSDEPDIAKDGQRKYSADVAVTYLADPGRKPVSEVISVSLMGADPSATITPGSPVEFDRLRCSVSSPEKREGSNRISGGRLFYMASAIRQGSPVNGRPLASAGAGKSE